MFPMLLRKLRHDTKVSPSMEAGQDQPVEVTENGKDQPVEVTENRQGQPVEVKENGQGQEEEEEPVKETRGEFLLWLWDAFDLSIFLLWTWLYKDHVSNDDRFSFLIVSSCVLLPGFYLLLRAVYDYALEKAKQKCAVLAELILYFGPQILALMSMFALLQAIQSVLDWCIEDDGIENDGVHNLTVTK